MKYFHSIILTGLMIHFLPLNAENAQAENTLPLAFMADQEEAPLTSLDEELSLLDEEFEEFKDELSSLEEATQQKVPVFSAIAEQDAPSATPENEQVAINELPKAVQELSAAIETSPAKTHEAEETVQIAESSFDAEPDEVMKIDSTEPVAIDTVLTISDAPAVSHETILAEKDLEQDTPATLNIQGTSLIGEPSPLNTDAITVDLQQAFSGSPIIYSLLLAMSVFSVCLWLYSIFSTRSTARVPQTLLKNVQHKLNSNNFEEALLLCEENNNLFCKMVLSGIQSRRHGLPVMIEAMKAEGKRSTVSYWQKIGLLNDIAIIAPMLGLLGTVLGMFYAFYDVNRSIESISTLFDGLGISVGTTVGGLCVAILALILHSTAKYRLVQALAQVENQAQSIAVMIDDRTSIYKG